MKIRLIATLALAAALPYATSAVAGEAEAQKGGCMACHAKEKKLVGPSFKDISAKYAGDATAPGKLADKVRKGGAGTWGQIPMPPNPAEKISDADLKTVIGWILKGG